MSDLHHAESVLRSGPEERDYLLKRAEDHRLLGERCDESGSRAIHARLEQRYREQALLAMMVLPD